MIKHPWIDDIKALIDEYESLEGLEDAYRASQIINEIIEIIEEV